MRNKILKLIEIIFKCKCINKNDYKTLKESNHFYINRNNELFIKKLELENKIDELEDLLEIERLDKERFLNILKGGINNEK